MVEVKAVVGVASAAEWLNFGASLLHAGTTVWEIPGGGGVAAWDTSGVVGEPWMWGRFEPPVEADTLLVRLSDCFYSHVLEVWGAGANLSLPYDQWGKPLLSADLPTQPTLEVREYIYHLAAAPSPLKWVAVGGGALIGLAIIVRALGKATGTIERSIKGPF